MWDTIIINPMVNILLGIYMVLSRAFGSAHMFGLAIILFTILVRLITHPLMVKQMRSSQVMQEMQQDPEWQEIQKKHKGDKEKLQQEQLKLYQKKGFNPLAPCLPTLIQFPIMIGLYQAIMRSLSSSPAQLLDLTTHIYRFIDPAEIIPINSHFLWMNLNQPERVLIFGIGIPVLAILVAITTYLQSKMMTPPAQAGEQSAEMTQSMNLMMPLMMGWFAYQYSSGLAVYFVIGNLIGIAQYAAMGKLNWRLLLPGNRVKGNNLVIEPKKEPVRETKKARKS